MRHALAALLSLTLACTPEDGSPDDDTDVDEVAPDPTPVFAPLDDEGEVVEDVELGRYTGIWYEIGTYLIPFQAACTGSTAQYAPLDEDTISVVNRCLLDRLDGDVYRLEGRADIVNETNTKLSVSFFGDFGAPYWVIERDGTEGEAPYTWAVVSGPGSTSLWILHREPQMPDSLLDPILDTLEARGFDLEAISWTEQPEEPFTEEELAAD